MKLPYLAFFVGDWLKDPGVTVCRPATRGIWMDLLCVMHEQDRSGVITGTREQLARLGRCSTVELASALDDLRITRTADVSERAGTVTLVNRRMKREKNGRESTRLRVSKHRRNTLVTPIEADAENSSSGRGEGVGEGQDADVPTLADVKQQGEMSGVPAASCQSFFNHHEGNNLWFNRFGRLINWRQKLASWAVNDRSKPTNGAHVVVHQKEYDRVIARMAAIKSTYGDHQTWSELDRNEFNKLRDRKRELKTILGITV